MDFGRIFGYVLMYTVAGLIVCVASSATIIVHRLTTLKKIGVDPNSQEINEMFFEMAMNRKRLEKWKNVPLIVRLFLWPITLGLGFIDSYDETNLVRDKILKIRELNG